MADNPIGDNPQYAPRTLTVGAISCGFFLTVPVCRLQLDEESNSVFPMFDKNDLGQGHPAHAEMLDELLDHCGRTHWGTRRSVDVRTAAIPLQSRC